MVVNRLSFIVPTYVKYNRVDINSLMMLWACGGDNGIGCKVVLFLCHNYLLQNVMHFNTPQNQHYVKFVIRFR